MVASGIPATAAMVAAPIRKLWPEYGGESTPAIDNAVHNSWSKPQPRTETEAR